MTQQQAPVKSLLQVLGHGQGYVKAGFLGFQGSGKTYTATLLAIGIRHYFGLSGPIGFVDTENATEYIAPLVRSLTANDLVGARTRDFDLLVRIGQECEKTGVSVLVVDSMTHFWRSLCDSYLAGLNEQLAKRGRSKRMKLEFQDWGQVKGQWARWSDFYLNSALHIIICGRAGYEYDMERNEDTGRNELIKTGIKMKTEAEFGFEPSLLVQMECVEEPAAHGKFRQVRSATVKKDRFGRIDAEVFTFGKQKSQQEELALVMKCFGPHIEMLKPGTHSTVATNVPPMEVNEEGDAEWARERKARTIYCEEIQGLLVSKWPSTSAEEKKNKADAINTVFGTRSWTAVESMKSERLREGLEAMRKLLGIAVPERPQPAPEPEPAKLLSDELLTKVEQAIGDHAVKALRWMREPKNGWLQADQAFQHLSTERAERIIRNPEQFITAISA